MFLYRFELSSGVCYTPWWEHRAREQEEGEIVGCLCVPVMCLCVFLPLSGARPVMFLSASTTREYAAHERTLQQPLGYKEYFYANPNGTQGGTRREGFDFVGLLLVPCRVLHLAVWS